MLAVTSDRARVTDGSGSVGFGGVGRRRVAGETSKEDLSQWSKVICARVKGLNSIGQLWNKSRATCLVEILT